MGTTAEKLTYLNTTKGKIKDSINLTGANIGSNDTFRSYAVKLRDGLLNVLNNGTIVLYNNFPKVSGTGSNISLSNTLEAPMFINKLDGDTLQDGTPSPSSPVEIQCVEGIQNVSIVGKNLLNVINSESGGIDSNGNLTTGKTLWRTNEYIEVKPNTTYTFSRKIFNDSTQRFLRLYEYDSNKTFITPRKETQNDSLTITTTLNTKYLKWTIYEANATLTLDIVKTWELQIEQGSSATTYQPYRSQTVQIDLGNIKMYDGDYITGTPDNWSIYRENGEATLTGSESYSTWGLKSTDYFSAYTYKLSSKPAVTNGNIKCDYLPFSNYTVVANATNMGCFTGGTYIGISVPKSILSDTSTQANAISSLKSWITSNNMNFVYELATPTTTPITDTTLISQLNNVYNMKSYDGQTNISVSGNLPMILEVSALKDEI